LTFFTGFRMTVSVLTSGQPQSGENRAPLRWGWADLTGWPRAGAVVTLVYLVGMTLIWFGKETKGRPLPE